jgi:hypothetical protein
MMATTVTCQLQGCNRLDDITAMSAYLTNEAACQKKEKLMPSN